MRAPEVARDSLRRPRQKLMLSRRREAPGEAGGARRAGGTGLEGGTWIAECPCEDSWHRQLRPVYTVMAYSGGFAHGRNSHVQIWKPGRLSVRHVTNEHSLASAAHPKAAQHLC